MIQFDEHIFQTGWFNHQLEAGDEGKFSHASIQRTFLVWQFWTEEHWDLRRQCPKFENTPQKTNIEPEKGPLEKEKDLQSINFGVPC